MNGSDRSDDACPARLTRRDFLAAGAAALASGVVVSGCARKEVRRLGRTGLEVTPLGMGGGGIEADVYKAGLDAGINFIHTSLSYGTLDRAAQALAGRREKVLLGLKLGRMTEAYLDASLEQLQTDYVDILFFPLVTPADAADRSHLELFQRLQKRNKARVIGITVHSDIAATLEAAVTAGFWDVLMASYVPDQEARAALRPVLDQAAKQNLGVVAMKTMAGIAPQALPEMQTALKEVLAHPAVSTVVKGSLSFESLPALMQAVGLRPTKAESAALQAHLASRRGVTCFVCGACPPCPQGVNVFEVIRDLDYFYAQEGQPEFARRMYREIPPSARGSACDNCGTCASKCPYGLDIARRVRAADLVLG